MQLDNDGAESSVSRAEEEGSVEWLNAYRATEEIFIPSAQRFVNIYWLLTAEPGIDPPVFSCSANGYLDAEYRVRERLTGEGYNGNAPIRTREIYLTDFNRKLARS